MCIPRLSEFAINMDDDLFSQDLSTPDSVAHFSLLTLDSLIKPLLLLLLDDVPLIEQEILVFKSIVHYLLLIHLYLHLFRVRVQPHLEVDLSLSLWVVVINKFDVPLNYRRINSFWVR